MKLYSEKQVVKLLKLQRDNCVDSYHRNMEIRFAPIPSSPKPVMEIEDGKKIHSCKECGVFVFTADGRHCINGHLYFPPIPDNK